MQFTNAYTSSKPNQVTLYYTHEEKKREKKKKTQIKNWFCNKEDDEISIIARGYINYSIYIYI